MNSIYELIFACFVTGCIILGIVMLIDFDRERKQNKKDERRDKRIVFEHEMELIREEREDEGNYHWGEIRVRVRRGRKKVA